MPSMIRRLRKSGQRGLGIEYTLIAFLAASAVFQVLIAVGAKGSFI
jgi:hypothetical protein